MDLSLGFITKLVDEDRFIRTGIDAKYLSEDYISVFKYIGRHHAEYKSVPSRDAVKKAFPNFEFGNYKEPLEYFVDALKEQYRKNVFDERLTDIARVYTTDTQKAEDILRSTLSQLSVADKAHKDVDLVATASDRIGSYRVRKENPGATGILTGWGSMDYQTLGAQPEEFIVLVGEKYTGKSWLLLWWAYQAFQQGERVLFNTKEMASEAITRRFDSIYASVPFDSLRRGELTQIEEEKYEQSLQSMANASGNFVVARDGVNTIEDIEAKAIEHDSTIVFADSVYLFPADSRSTQNNETGKRMAISQRCKETATRLGIPFVSSVQGGRRQNKSRKPNLDDIEWSNAFSQDAETVVYADKTDLDVELKRRSLYLLKSRDGDIADFFVNANFAQMKFDEREGEVSEPTTNVFEDDEQVLWTEQT